MGRLGEKEVRGGETRMLTEAPGVLAVIGSDNLEARAMAIPGRKALRMLSSDTRGGTVGTPADAQGETEFAHSGERKCMLGIALSGL